ncbi:putative outer membrane protein [Jejuia pallidilutea]|uniref:Putative outer membrane protein n=2 Tax=Jejuia pallidilutea TaxID=504487 RepID=A0A090VWP0_9FLAO|nr:putative outer membrane protein [Jejuia pallidilutea]GAL72349.1 putative outer membrane protein [Jejuia pallidilutea]GAL89497.1 putative outer membrane protein [Jejuia pallidilutea]
MTDFDGNFSLDVPRTGVLVISYIGFESKEVVLGNSNQIKIQLNQSTEELDEIVVTALGVKREARSLTSAQQTVNTEGLKEARTTNFAAALSGVAAGVQVTNAQTASGSNRVTIRGVTSLSGNNQPLYVLDGVPLDQTLGDEQSGAWGNAVTYAPVDYGDPISSLNPDDIEGIEVLKGASASALYGSRAANGVILITTKKGTKKKGMGVTINSNTTLQTVNQFPDYQYQYGSGSLGSVAINPTFVREIDGVSYPTLVGQNSAYGGPLLGYDVIEYDGTIGTYSSRPDNIRELYKTGVTNILGVQLSQANDNSTFRLGYTYTDGDWIMDRQDQIERHNITLRATSKLSDRLSVDASMIYIKNNVTNRVVENGSPRNPSQNYIQMHPNMYRGNLTPWKDENGNAFRTGNVWLSNPYWNINENTNEDDNGRFIGRFDLTYNIIKDWDVTAKVNADIRNSEGFQYYAPGATYDIDGSYSAYNNKSENWNFELISTYRKNFDKLSLVAIAGANSWKFNFSRRNAIINQLLFPDVLSLSNNAGDPLVEEFDSERVLNSVFGSVNLGYNNTVYLDISARSEWSSTLSLENNNFTYGSAGMSLIFSKLTGTNNIFSFGKLRGSVAEVGNSATPYQVFDTYLYGGNFQGIPWVSPFNTKNRLDLKNETTRSFEVGLETKFLKNRISLNATYYKTSSFDQILNGPVSPTTGFTSSVINAGEITNKGFEVYLNARVIDSRFKWDIDLNWSNNESFVEEIDPQVPRVILNQWGGRTRIVADEGQPYGNIVTSDFRRDENGIPVINPLNGKPFEVPDVVVGNFQPDWIGSVRNSFKYKGFYLNVLVDVKKGGDLFSGSFLRANQFGTHAATLAGRDEFLLSNRIIGEQNNERRGEGLFGNEYIQIRDQGAIYPGNLAVWADSDGDGTFDWEPGTEPNNIYLPPSQVQGTIWQYTSQAVFDASYVKLREMVFGFNFPKRLTDKTPFTTISTSIVGRNLWIIHQNTPKGIDPESNSTSGNGQGLEFGSFLPNSTFGLNVNLSF